VHSRTNQAAGDDEDDDEYDDEDDDEEEEEDLEGTRCACAVVHFSGR
jgi:hypothetical protein